VWGAPTGSLTEARKLIENAPSDPVTLKIVCPAFDEAWNSIEANFGDYTQTVEMVRFKIARIMFALRQAHMTDVERVKTSALEMMALLY